MNGGHRVCTIPAPPGAEQSSLKLNHIRFIPGFHSGLPCLAPNSQHTRHPAFRLQARPSCFGAPWTNVLLPRITWRIPLPFQAPWNSWAPVLSVPPSFNLCNMNLLPGTPVVFVADFT